MVVQPLIVHTNALSPCKYFRLGTFHSSDDINCFSYIKMNCHIRIVITLCQYFAMHKSVYNFQVLPSDIHVCALINILIGSQVKFAVAVTRYIMKHQKCSVQCIHLKYINCTIVWHFCWLVLCLVYITCAYACVILRHLTVIWMMS